MKRKVDISYSQLPQPTKIKDVIKELNRHPDDSELWESVDAALKEIKATPAPRPPGSFTVHEIAAHWGLSRGAAARRVKMLLDAGKCKKIGQGNTFYYVMVGK